MFERLKQTQGKKSDDDTISTISLNSKTKSIRKRSNHQIVKAMRELKKKLTENIKSAQQIIDEVVLEESQSFQPQRENVMDDRKKQTNRNIVSKTQELVISQRMAQKKHTMVRRRVNQLINEELSQ